MLLSRKRESEGNAEKMLWLHQFWLRNYIFALAGQAHRDRNGRFRGSRHFQFLLNSSVSAGKISSLLVPGTKKDLKSWRSDSVSLLKVNIFDDFRFSARFFLLFLLAQGVAQVVLIRNSHVSLLEANYLM